MPNKYSHFGPKSFHISAHTHNRTKTYARSLKTHAIRLFTWLLAPSLSPFAHTKQSELDNGSMYSLSLRFLILYYCCLAVGICIRGFVFAFTQYHHFIHFDVNYRATK